MRDFAFLIELNKICVVTNMGVEKQHCRTYRATHRFDMLMKG